jgi:hypothetical protein
LKRLTPLTEYVPLYKSSSESYVTRQKSSLHRFQPDDGVGLIVGVTDGVGCGVSVSGGHAPVTEIAIPTPPKTLPSQAQIDIEVKLGTGKDSATPKQSV